VSPALEVYVDLQVGVGEGWGDHDPPQYQELSRVP